MDEKLNRCVGCGGTDFKKLLPSSFGFKCPRQTSEIAPRHYHWHETEGRRRMALPSMIKYIDDNGDEREKPNPEKLVPVSKSHDIMHGDGGGTPDVPKTTEADIAGHIEEWKSLGSPSKEKVLEMFSGTPSVA
jgi:hypothetical protein